VEAITIQNLSKVFEGGAAKSKVIALENVSFNIDEGEFFCIIGPSGCGKTTLLHIIAGFTTPSSGAARYHGAPIDHAGPDRIVIFQEYGLFPWMTVSENIEFGLKAKGLPAGDRRALVRKFVEMVHLNGFEDRYPAQISGGMKQRVGIARALAPDPEVVLMDEPFGALDSLTRDLMQEEILRIWSETERKTFVLITHNIDEAIFLSDHVLIMTSRPGRVKEIVKIDLPRPRDPEIRNTSKQFFEYREHLAHLLRSEAQSAIEG
jgi:NitT/TauT family transport system ATP-binding protein